MNRRVEFEALNGSDAIPVFAQEHGAEALNLPFDGDGQTPLTAAAKSGKTGLMLQLLESGANPDQHDLEGATPLIHATKVGRADCVRVLVKAGCDINKTDPTGRSAFMYALYHGHEEVAKLLAKAKTNASRPDLDGRSAIDYARHYLPGKPVDALVKLARAAGSTDNPSNDKRTLISLHPYFVALGHLKRIRGFRLFATAVSLWFIIVLTYLAAKKLRLMVLGDCYPLYLAPTWDVLAFQGTIFAATCAVIFALLRARIKRRLKQIEPVATGTREGLKWSELNTPGSLRSISGVLKFGGRKMFADKLQHRQRGEGSNYSAFIAISGLFFFYPALYATLASLLSLIAWSMFDELQYTLAMEMLFGYFIPNYNMLDQLLTKVQNLQLPPNSILILLTFFTSTIFVTYLFIKISETILSRRLFSEQRKYNDFIEEILKEKKDQFPLQQRFVLYLRCFEHDNSINIGNFNFEAALAYSLNQSTDIIALGRGSDQLGPITVQTEDAHWKLRFKELAGDAAAIVMIPAATQGVLWEIETLKRQGYLEKTVFVMPPEPTTKGKKLADGWTAMLAAPELSDFEFPPYHENGCVFRLDATGRLLDWNALGLELEPPPLAVETPQFQLNHSHQDIGYRLSPAVHTTTSHQAAIIHSQYNYHMHHSPHTAGHVYHHHNPSRL